MRHHRGPQQPVLTPTPAPTPTPTPTPTPAPQRYHAKALLVSFDDSGSGASSHVDALTKEIQLGFRRLDGDIRAMGPPGGGRGAGAAGQDGGVQLQVQRQLAQALFKLSVEFRWGRQGAGGVGWGVGGEGGDVGAGLGSRLQRSGRRRYANRPPGP
jgi:hypothetical protein